MNTLQDVREAQQMWEYKFKNAGREGVVLRIGKPRGLLSSIVNKVTAKHATSSQKLRDGFLPV